MDTKRFVIGTPVGGITMYLVGHLIWELAFAGFFAANAGSATDVKYRLAEEGSDD